MDFHSSGGPRGRALAALAVLGLLGAVGGYGIAQRERPQPVRIEVGATPGPQAEEGSVLMVHVSGAVQEPGLYVVPDGGRVDDAVRAAGGAREDADLDAVNLAAKVHDGEKLQIPVRGQAPVAQAAGAAEGSSGRVNLNTAGPEELQTLPGIGPALADRIISHRTQQGPFRAVRELLNVSGIGPKKFEALQDLVAV